eukprot:9499060-Pyramimonas_sp.AAC.1
MSGRFSGVVVGSGWFCSASVCFFRWLAPRRAAPGSSPAAAGDPSYDMKSQTARIIEGAGLLGRRRGLSQDPSAF